MGNPTITDVTITPIAIADPPLLNASGVHEPYALRSIIEVHTDAGITGISEAYGDAPSLANQRDVVDTLRGLDIFNLNELSARVSAALSGARSSSPTDLLGANSTSKTTAQAYGAFEVALFDLQGKATGLRVCDLLGGAVRESVPFSAYLFYKFGAHPQGTHPGDYPADPWSEALDPEGIVAQARRMVDLYGFQSLKLKGGVFEPEAEADAMQALRDAFPGYQLRLDPNANWTVETTKRILPRLEGLLEYLEDPTGGNPGMAEVAAMTDVPLATNMCVTSMEEIPEAVALDSISVLLSDHHYWGGLRVSQTVSGICDTFGWGMSMHSNSHLGISLAAMTHLAAATPNLTYACDTHTPWQSEEVIEPGALTWRDGSMTVPDGPGLGVVLDRDSLARLHEQYEATDIRTRDDATAMHRFDPTWPTHRPRF